jgi:anaerobic selenocysteine-containing dehydrogenase
MSETRTAFRICPLCEATCGLELRIEDDRITRVRGDRDDIFSNGFICPKGSAFGHVVHDPDRLHHPLIREGDTWREVDWQEAFAEIDRRLADVIAKHGRDAIGAYAGNPNVHNLAGGLFLTHVLRALGSRNLFTASTMDQLPKQVACGYLYGNPNLVAVPDLDRTDFALLLGADPYESNGSLATAPDWPGRLASIQERGGELVVVDPRRSKTADVADEHIAIHPGTDALFLAAIANVLLTEELATPGRAGEHTDGLDRLPEALAPFTPDAVAERCGVDADRICSLARRLAAAERAVVYGRIGTTTVSFGTLTSWLVDVCNLLTGNLDEPGGAMFPLAPHQRRAAAPGGRGFTTGRWTSRVKGLPEANGELPTATLADEIETPGDGQIKAMFVIAGNPVLSAPNGDRIETGLASLDLLVSVDPSLNETSRLAHVVLPPADGARNGHYDVGFTTLQVRNVARYSPPALPPDPEGMDEADILLHLLSILRGDGPDPDIATIADGLVLAILERAVAADSRLADRRPDELLALIDEVRPAERMLDAMLRTGAYGDGFGADPDGLTLATVRDSVHGIDLGPLQPRLPEVLRTKSGRIDLMADPVVADLERLRATLDEPRPDTLLVGRRHLRSNNSWMHNVRVLVKGKPRCTLLVHPDDAVRFGLSDGSLARVASKVGEIEAVVELTDRMRPGVVSLPHGWGHGKPGTRLSIANEHAGVNSNLLTDESVIDPLSGTVALNAIPVEVSLAG